MFILKWIKYYRESTTQPVMLQRKVSLSYSFKIYIAVLFLFVDSETKISLIFCCIPSSWAKQYSSPCLVWRWLILPSIMPLALICRSWCHSPPPLLPSLFLICTFGKISLTGNDKNPVVNSANLIITQTWYLVGYIQSPSL